MTADAPSHLKWRALLENFHFLHLPMAFLALQSSAALVLGLNVTLVREAHKIGKIVNLDPFNRLIVVVSFGDFFDGWTICPYNLVASHTGVTRRDTGGE